MSAPIDEAAPQPSFTPHPALVREPMFPEHRATLEDLEDLRDGIRSIDFTVLDAARENHQQYATALASPTATGPLPIRVPGATLRPAPLFDAFADAGHRADPQPSAVLPVAAPEPEPDSVWLLDFLELLLDDAAEGAGRRIGEPCPNCPGTLSGWCEDCQDALARAARYERLAELVEAAPGDRAAVLVLMAGAWRDGVSGGIAGGAL
jgi:hypothetical protein